MIIPLGNATRAEVIDSVLGQLSDGIWENRSSMDKYWRYADVDDNFNLVIDEDNSWNSGFRGKSESWIKNWFADKAKQVVKIWAEDFNISDAWNRDSTEEVDYMGGHVKKNITVADVYECYDYLKGRSTSRKYGKEESTEPVAEAPKTAKTSGGMNPSQQEVEDFFLDASTDIKSCSKKCGTKYPSDYVKAGGYAVGEDEQFKLMKKKQAARSKSPEDLLNQYALFLSRPYSAFNEAVIDILHDEILRRMK